MKNQSQNKVIWTLMKTAVFNDELCKILKLKLNSFFFCVAISFAENSYVCNDYPESSIRRFEPCGHI